MSQSASLAEYSTDGVVEQAFHGLGLNPRPWRSTVLTPLYSLYRKSTGLNPRPWRSTVLTEDIATNMRVVKVSIRVLGGVQY